LSHPRKIFGRNQTNFFGHSIVTIEMFEKKMFQIMCHMMGCNDHTFAFVRSAKVACIDLASQQKQKRKTALLVR